MCHNEGAFYALNCVHFMHVLNVHFSAVASSPLHDFVALLYYMLDMKTKNMNL